MQLASEHEWSGEPEGLWRNSPETIEAQLEEAEVWLELDRFPEAMKVSEDALGKLKGDSEEIVRLQAVPMRLCRDDAAGS